MVEAIMPDAENIFYEEKRFVKYLFS